MYIKVQYKGVEATGEEAKQVEGKLVLKSKKLWKPCCLFDKPVGEIEWEVAPRAGRAYKLYECPLCKRISFELLRLS